MQKWLEKIHANVEYDAFSKYANKKNKKIEKLSSQVTGILNRPIDNPIWENKSFWDNVWPKLVMEQAEEVERDSLESIETLRGFSDCRDFLDGKTLMYNI